MSKNKRIVKYRKPFSLNIGVVIFIFIFIYLLFNVFSYLTKTHISVYEVGQGTMAENNTYKGLIIREEQVYNSNYSGDLTCYVKDTSKVKHGNLIYSVDESGDVSKLMKEASQSGLSVSSEEMEDIENTIDEFRTSYDSLQFYNTYTFKEEMNASLEEAINLNALHSVSEYIAINGNSNTFHQIYSDRDGIVIYYTDGYETVTTENFTASLFDEAAYNRTSSRQNTSIEAGNPVYKLITSELWHIILPISPELSQKLADDDTLQLQFVQDEKKAYATYTLTQKEGQHYAILTLKNSMIRYAKDRYIEVELLLSEKTGLKIPNSAIVEKEFYKIPVEYFMKGENSEREKLTVEHIEQNGSVTTETVIPTVYYTENDQYFYIDNEFVSSGDIIRMEDSNTAYTVGTDIGVLKGVYNINKGYAVFKQIVIIYQNEEYAIIEKGTSYGISLYDHIALDAAKIQEDELIK